MPLQFASKIDYISKLIELLMVEAESERVRTESVAQKDIQFVFEQRLEIYSRLLLKIPKSVQQYIRKNVILSVVIREAVTGHDYVGTGVVKAIIVKRNDPDMTVSMQIDVMDPLDRKFR